MADFEILFVYYGWTLGVLDPDTTRATSAFFSLDLVRFLLNFETY